MTDVALARRPWVGTRRRSTVAARWPVLLSGAWLAGMALIALTASWLAPHDPQATDLGAADEGVSAAHWLGTDEVGRDIASRIMWGSRVSLASPLLVVVFATSMGLTLALLAAWWGGHTDSIVTAVVDVMLGFPGLLLALLCVALFGVGVAAPVLALTLAYAPYFARITRAIAKRERSLPYISALVGQGYGAVRITTRHLVLNILPLLLAQAAILFGYAMVDLAAISYLGLGVQPPTPDWGNMVASGQNGVLRGSPQVALSAGAAIVLTVIAVNVMGEWIADRSARGRS